MATTFRQANETDKEFLTTTIVEAEKGDYHLISYCSIFDLSEDEFRDLVGKIFDEEIEGQEICYSNFIILEIDGERAATVGAFVEKPDGLSSNTIKMNLLMYLLDRDKLLNAAPMISVMNEIALPREEKALQFEYAYIAPQFRGQGLLRVVMEEQVRVRKAAGLASNKMQIIILENNIGAKKSHEKFGFKITGRKQSANPDIYKLVSCDTKILMEMEVE